ncbi:hypothetical protein ANCCAN_02453 [Ancylostoma caninum]|uniref:HMG box domain-containing protein n=1 Tax=Ancylostoma caninum TaxID=29170 RepID=A0A368H4G1_ANCCA|nr:hypothetical protein ANCCAN_02453 [Ancylostoma caninum]
MLNLRIQMSSPQSAASGSRAASPDDENGKPRPQSPAPAAISRLDRHADLKRRSAQAFTVFANEERDRLLKTRPDLPMGLVTRMMVEKWRSLDNEAKKPYFDAARASPPLKIVKSSNDASSEIIPTKKWRPIVTYSQPAISVPVRDQTVGFEQIPEQTPGRVIIVQGIRLFFMLGLCLMFLHLAGKLATPVVEVPKNPSAISASIAQALGVTIVTPQRSSAAHVPTPVMPPPIRTPAVRTKVLSSTAGLSSLRSSTPPVSSSSDAQTRSDNTVYGFSNSQQALDMFYLALCEPAFPHPNEPPLTPFPANYCYEAYLRLTSGQ